jgi:hypothetical protein
VVIIGVAILALILLGLFYGFYTLVLKEDDEASTPTPESTVTLQAVQPTQEPVPSATNTTTSEPSTPTVAFSRSPTDTPEPSPMLRPPPEVITVGVRACVNISEGLGINLRDLPALSGSTVIT